MNTEHPSDHAYYENLSDQATRSQAEYINREYRPLRVEAIRELLRKAAAIGVEAVNEGSMTSDELYALTDAATEAEAWAEVRTFDEEGAW